jgi:hypothetical protein
MKKLMKRFWVIAMCAAIGMSVTQPANAQFLKKLKGVVKQATESVSRDVKNTVSPTTQRPVSQSQQGVAATTNKTFAEQTKSLAGRGKTYYVNIATGSNRNDGSKASPFKNIQAAIDAADHGATICVAEGVYMGKLNIGYVDVNKYVNLIGGYSSDFSERDPLRHLTLFQPDDKVAAAGTNTLKGLFEVYVRGNRKGQIVIDGFVFDRGNSNSYFWKTDRKTSSWPIGVESPRLFYAGMGGCQVLHKSSKAFANVANPEPPCDGQGVNTNAMVHGDVEGDVTIQNCVFVNGSWFGIQMGNIGGHWRVVNNVFVNNRMAACEIRSMNKTVGEASLEFAYNTVLFSWTRMKPDGADIDMGYGVRCMTGVNMDINHNIFGCNFFAAIDRTYVDADKTKEAQRVTTAESNRFFLNRESDILLPGTAKFQRVFCKDFEDVDKLAKAVDNKDLADPAFIKAINKPYLQAWNNYSCSESSSYNANSTSNQVREIFGMNKQGSFISRPTMHANYYPTEDTYRLFGVVNGYGAQTIR